MFEPISNQFVFLFQYYLESLSAKMCCCITKGENEPLRSNHLMLPPEAKAYSSKSLQSQQESLIKLMSLLENSPDVSARVKGNNLPWNLF